MADKIEMPDTREVEEHIREWLLNDQKVMRLVAQMVQIDVNARFPDDMPMAQWEECNCVSQTRMVAFLLNRTQEWFLG